MNLLITICGRAGSKGVKSKNIRDFLGKPLIYYTLISALQYKQKKQSEAAVDICVSSNSMELLNIAGKYEGVFTIVRPDELSTDLSPKVPVIQHATKTMEENLGRKYDIVMDLDITSPLRKLEDMEKALDMLLSKSHNYDLVFSAVKARRNPYFNMVEIHDGIARKVKDSNFVARQEAPQVFDMNASIYCYKRNSLINKLKRITFEGISGMFEMQDTCIIDIDNEHDFKLLEILVKNYYCDIYPDLFQSDIENQISSNG